MKASTEGYLDLSYAVQDSPDGLAQAFLIGAHFLAGSPSCLVLGDNVFYGHGLPDLMHVASRRETGATVFACQVEDPERYGIVSFDESQKVISIEEKPRGPTSNWAVTGLYFYDADVVEIAKSIRPSDRGELEITAVNAAYLDRHSLFVERMGRGYAWFDAGTHASLLDTSEFISTIQERQGLLIASPEEVAFNMGWITAEQLEKLARPLAKNGYGRSLLRLIESGA